jgi:hypothetical protein
MSLWHSWDFGAFDLSPTWKINKRKWREGARHLHIYIGLIMTVVQIHRWKCNRFNEAKKLWGSPTKHHKDSQGMYVTRWVTLFCPRRIMYNEEMPTALLSIRVYGLMNTNWCDFFCITLMVFMFWGHGSAILYPHKNLVFVTWSEGFWLKYIYILEVVIKRWKCKILY